jgi:integral membrane protein (TIGR03766 family)
MKKQLLKLLNYIFFVVILYTLYGTFKSKILDFASLGSLVFKLFVFFVIVSSIFCLWRSPQWVLQKLKEIFLWLKNHYDSLAKWIFVLIVILQFSILYFISVPISWDVGGIHNGVAELGQTTLANDYLSTNPNNSFFFFFMLMLSKLGNLIHPTIGTSWFYWQSLNIIFMDLGFIFIYLAGKNLFNEKVGYLSFYLAIFSLGLSPWILVPYTDTIMLPIISSIFYLFSYIRKQKQLILFPVLSIMTAIAFLLKPSSVVFLIAYLIIVFLDPLQTFSRKKILPLLTVVLCFFLVFAGTLKAFSFFESKQTIVIIDKNKAKPWQHFVMMGLKGTGGFNQADTDATNGFSTQEEKVAYAKKQIISRLEKYGFIGYLKFLSQKHLLNTSRGDFSWGRDGTPQVAPASKNPLTLFLRDSYYQQGERVKMLRLFMHLLWIITLIGLLFTIRKKDRWLKCSPLLFTLKLTVLGSFLYLLLFEGGRSRYLIQYLPVFYLLSANGWYLQFFHKRKQDPSLSLKNNKKIDCK